MITSKITITIVRVPPTNSRAHERVYVLFRVAFGLRRDYSGHMYATLRESKAKLSSLVERASAGEEVLITVRGHPKARLCPIDAESRFEGGDFVRELETIQTKYRVRGKMAVPSETIISKLREDRL